MPSQSEFMTTNAASMILSKLPKPPITARDAGNLDLLAGKIAHAASDNGWHDRYRELVDAGDHAAIVDHIISKIMLVVSELSEAVEEFRAGFTSDYIYYRFDMVDGPGVTVDAATAVDADELREIGAVGIPKPEGPGIELADAVIRLLDLMGMLNLDIGALVRQKLAYNVSRGRMHGGKTV